MKKWCENGENRDEDGDGLKVDEGSTGDGGFLDSPVSPSRFRSRSSEAKGNDGCGLRLDCGWRKVAAEFKRCRVRVCCKREERRSSGC